MTAKIIAEISSNHNGDLCRCLDMIVAAKNCGCWAAKFQLYRSEELPGFDPNVNLPIPDNWLPHLFAVAAHTKIELFASVFDRWSVDILKKYTTTFKIASPESTRLTKELYYALKQAMPFTKLVFVSSGQADWNSMRAIFCGGGGEMKLLYCKSGYPATIDASDLDFSKRAAGFSDHTADIIAPLAMIGAGAQYIEKHFKLDDNCPDAAFSLNPDQMKMLCDLAK